MTNGDVIRKMTDEELAHFLAQVGANVYRAESDIIAYRADDVADALEWISMETQLKYGCDDCLCRDCLENCNENSDGCCYTCCKDSDECKPICRCPFGWYHDN